MQRRLEGLRPRPPFSLDLTAGYQTYFTGETGADHFHNGVFQRLLERDGRLLLASARSARQPEEVDTPGLEVEVLGEEVRAEDAAWALDRVAWILGAQADLRPFYAWAEGDPVLRGITRRLYGLHPPRMPTLFEGLVFAIAGQQVASTIARMVRTLLTQTYGPRLSLDGHTYHAFPSPHALLEAGLEGLRRCKLSTRKAEYILDLATRIRACELDPEAVAGLPSEELIARLCQWRGIGRWTAEWVLLRAMGRPDVFPAGDLALRRTVAAYYTGGAPMTEAEARSLAERFVPFQQLVTVYLFTARHLGLGPESTPGGGQAP
ncbi:MAG: DNA-3-methyladenine glycosylase 2 family protein [Chloroflexi bacterium]|nr:DNA-3-methyladenine glycosylase 2 family protein [Chloroflexota bacterium]